MVSGSSTAPCVLSFQCPAWRFRLRRHSHPSTASSKTPAAAPMPPPTPTPTVEPWEGEEEGVGEELLGGIVAIFVVEGVVLDGLDVAEGVEVLLVVVVGSSVEVLMVVVVGSSVEVLMVVVVGSSVGAANEKRSVLLQQASPCPLSQQCTVCSSLQAQT